MSMAAVTHHAAPMSMSGVGTSQSQTWRARTPTPARGHLSLQHRVPPDVVDVDDDADDVPQRNFSAGCWLLPAT